ncbi:MAG: FKBP-type peptidyl-prolyl cis-trans isomerase [Vicingaceae bacterium]
MAFAFAYSCGQRNSNKTTGTEIRTSKDPLIEENKRLTLEESRIMDRYIERRKWDMTTTGTGLRYMIYENGYGVDAAEGMRATVNYEIALMDGTLCYSSDEQGPRTFTIGRDNVESGIHEGITYMKVGDKVKMLIPSYLAHGLVGDQNKIPPRSPLVVDLHLIRLD